MRIAILSCVYPPYRGGIGESAANFRKVLVGLGHEVAVFTPFYGPSGDEKIDGLVIRVKTFLKRGNAAVLWRLFRLLKDFDCVYLNYPFFGTAEIVWFLKKFFWGKKKRLIIHYHMDAVLPRGWLHFLAWPSELVFDSLFKEADLVVSGSLDYIKNSRLADFYGKNREKFAEMPYGVDADRFCPGVKTGPFKILFVGGLDRAHYFKGVEVLLAAAAELEKERQDWVLEIVGQGELKKNYEEKARSLGLGGKTTFSDKVGYEELPEKYRSADVLVLPSINKGEAFGIVLIEAMASGVPVIASDLPGVRSVFNDKREGLVSKIGDAIDLKDKIRFFLDNPDKEKEMGEAARALALERYSWKKIKDKLGGRIEKL